MSEVSVLSDKSAKLLSQLRDCFNKHDVSEPSNSGVHNVDNKVYRNQVTWTFNRSDLEKIEDGKYLESPRVDVEFLNIYELWLEMYPKRDNQPLSIVDLFLCFRNVPENVFTQCDIFALNNNRDIVWEERLCARSDEIKENKLRFNAFIGIERQNDQSLNKNLFIQCRIKFVSTIYTCMTDKREYTINETPRIDTSMEDILKNGKYSDVVLKIEDSHVKSHKSILALKSSSLRILLKLNREKEQELKNEEYTTLQDMLNFMYTEDIKILNFHHAWKLYNAAHKYDILNLKELCSVYLNANLTENNISYVFDLARDKDDDHLLQACIKFIKEQDIEVSKKAFVSKHMKK